MTRDEKNDVKRMRSYFIGAILGCLAFIVFLMIILFNNLDSKAAESTESIEDRITRVAFTGEPDKIPYNKFMVNGDTFVEFQAPNGLICVVAYSINDMYCSVPKRYWDKLTVIPNGN